MAETLTTNVHFEQEGFVAFAAAWAAGQALTWEAAAAEELTSG
jgi:hypothetical protein